MTVVVGLEHARSVLLGCDSLVSTADSRDVLRGPKWTRVGTLTLGFSGDLRAAQAAASLPAPRARRPREPHVAYLVAALVEPLRAHLDARGASLASDWLVVAGGRLYVVQSDWSVLASARGYAAIGSGAPYALGALAATPDAPPRDRLTAALAAAAEHCPSVGGPIHTARLR